VRFKRALRPQKNQSIAPLLFNDIKIIHKAENSTEAKW
jgi:hypothetical protein